ncbi:MAG: hypothetical protein JSW59_06535 [Phycisphaerales bacterium]|nr:MAG: hypothetical protein JSW59_06535 [Phycisphaerales bacterium]
MRPILQILALVTLIALTVPSVFFLAGRMELDTVKWIMLLATIIWFVAATPWMWKDNGAQE